MPKEMRWVGDLSRQDAAILEMFAYQNSVLEFGCGGSTLIFAQSGAIKVVSIETDKTWIDLTKERLEVLDETCPVLFVDYDEPWTGLYDVVFVDGIDKHRRDFAIRSWQFLKPNGTMIFHDTRRFADFQNAMWVAQLYYQEVWYIRVNFKNSNMTLIQKRSRKLEYENWNETEGKPKWAYGIPDGVGRTQLWTEN